ncbi:MAG: IS607 family transposase [Candidatus Lokiarchaeota archaeon]|nr:IS607 family transposase [Candidatus Lokiarchaeota archaeon]
MKTWTYIDITQFYNSLKSIYLIMMVSIGMAAHILGVCRKTLRRWEKNGVITPVRTPGNHRRYDKNALITFGKTGDYAPPEKTKTGNAAVYGRVSSHRQKDDLKRQISFLQKRAKNDGYTPKIYKDIGSGLNDKRKGLRRLVKHALTGHFDKVYVTYLDRLARFGTQIILDVFKVNAIDYEVVQVAEDVGFNQLLVNDVIALVTSFSGKLYRRRKGKNVTPKVHSS